MKKIILSLFAFLMFFFLVAQKMTEVKSSELPKSIAKYFHDNMPGAKILKAVRIEDKGTIKYNVAVDLKNKKYVYVFDKNGKFLKKGDDVTAPSNKVIINKADDKNKTRLPADSVHKSKEKDIKENFLVQEIIQDSIRNQP